MAFAPSTDTTARSALEARLDDPEVAASLATLLDHADLLAVLVTGLDGFVARTEVIGDSLIDGITELKGVASSSADDSGLDLAGLLDAGRSLAAALPQLTPSIVAAVESGAFEQVSRLTAGLAEGAKAYETSPVEVGGVFSLLKLLKDPDINRAISYGATIARSLGRELGKPQPPGTSGTSRPVMPPTA